MANEPKPDDRLRKQEGDAKVSRQSENREITEDRELTDASRLELLRGMSLQTILPDLPPIPGYHLVWLSTTNARDSIQARMRLGYTPVRPEEVPAFQFHESSINRGSTLGDTIAINEMVAFKLPEHLYQMYMTELHHTEPARQESALKETADRIRQTAQGIKANVEIMEGLENLNQPVSRPTFG